MSWSGLAKVLIGFFLAVALLVGAGAATAYYFFTKLSTPPPKPLFSNDKSVAKTKSTPRAVKKISASTAPSSQSPTPTPTPSATPSPQLEPGAYRARVTWRDGLILREQPTLEANRLGGIAYNQRVVVIKESDDKRWQQVRAEEGDQQGWVKAGNLERDDTAAQGSEETASGQ